MIRSIQSCLPTYTVCEKIGEGVYGAVYRVKDGLKERAVKVVSIEAERSVKYRSEADMDSRVSRDFHAVQDYYEQIKGNGVLEVYDFHLVNHQMLADKATADLVILMELCQTNLLNWVVDHYPLPPDVCRYFMKRIALILARLSELPEETFVVTDLKPVNFLIRKNGDLVIGDLGGLKRLGSVSRTVGSQFSPKWTAPEVLFQGKRPDIGAAVFSFGLVSYFLWEGELPYEEADFINRLTQIRDQGLPFNRADISLSDEYLMTACLAFKPEDRPSGFQEILAMLQDAGDVPLPDIAGSAKKTPAARPARLTEPVLYAPDESGSLQSVTTPPRATAGRQPAESFPFGRQWQELIFGIEFAWVPEGEGTQTASSADSGAGFWIARYPVTQGLWKRIMGHNPSRFDKGDGYPVENVSWNEAMAFIQKLNTRHGNRFSFQLPWYHQWKRAALSDAQSVTGSDPESLGWVRENSGLAPHPVGLLPANRFGICDLFGNVAEWCRDAPDAEAGASSSSLGPHHRLSCGGSWKQAAEEVCGAKPRRMTAALGYSDLGFRVVRNVDEENRG